MIYSSIRQAVRMLLNGKWTMLQWSRLHATRHYAVTGMALSMAQILPKLLIDWSEPLVFQSGDKTLSLPIQPRTDGSLILVGSLKGLLHDLRSFLRHALCRCVASRGLYFAMGLDDGWCEDDVVRLSTHSISLKCHILPLALSNRICGRFGYRLLV